MGKLNIAHHKSYHPYRRDNIERVRRDEEEAKLKESQEEGRMLLADSEARIDLLRERAGIHGTNASDKKGKKRREEREEMKLLDAATSGSNSAIQEAKLPTTNGHINLFEDLEKGALVLSTIASKQASKKKNEEDEKGVPLAPSTKDLNPWYATSSSTSPPSSRKGKGKASESDDKAMSASEARRARTGQADAYDRDPEDERRQRDEARKSTLHDPLWDINKQLSEAQRRGTTDHQQIPSYSRSQRLNDHRAPPSSTQPPQSSSSADDPTAARLSRESSERQRAMELIRRKKKEKEREMLLATPSTIRGDDDGDSYRYRDVFNRKELEEARLSRSHRDTRGSGRSRGWDRVRDRDRDRSHRR